jgi:hypothetical protein
VESHNLTFYLPMLLLVLKDSECASVAVTQMWLRCRKDYESKVLVLDFGGAIGRYSGEATVLQPSGVNCSNDEMLLLGTPQTWVHKTEISKKVNRNIIPLQLLFSSLFFFFDSIISFFISFSEFLIEIGMRITNEIQHDISNYGDQQLDEHNTIRVIVPWKGYRIFLAFQWTSGDEQKQ